MAEGDTILRTARRIDEALTGDRIEVHALSPRGRGIGLERLDARTLLGVEAKGKNLILNFGELALHSHLGMSGSWQIHPRGGSWRKPRGAAWALLGGEEREAVQFGGPTLRVVPAARLRRELSRLGPDILAPGTDLSAPVSRLRSASGHELGEALLDQSLVAGIGNIFKSEACFASRLNPWLRIDELSDEDLKDVLSAARELMMRSVESGRQPGELYRRAGQPCPSCGTAIAAEGQGDANRRTYWCPRCQPKARASVSR